MYKYISNIINSTNKDYINKHIKAIKDKYSNIKAINDIPYYLKGKGLPIGNYSSQFLSIYYLYRLDYKIVHTYKIKHYVRYMDDFILMHEDKEYLTSIRKVKFYNKRAQWLFLFFFKSSLFRFSNANSIHSFIILLIERFVLLDKASIFFKVAYFNLIVFNTDVSSSTLGKLNSFTVSPSCRNCNKM